MDKASRPIHGVQNLLMGTYYNHGTKIPFIWPMCWFNHVHGTLTLKVYYRSQYVHFHPQTMARIVIPIPSAQNFIIAPCDTHGEIFPLKGIGGDFG
jgi:hypothetical protein